MRFYLSSRRCRTVSWRNGSWPGARSTLLNSYATVGDSQGKLENFYLGQAATGRSETPADLAQAVMEVSAERICRAMSTVKLDTVYFLKGKEAQAEGNVL